MTAQQKRLQIEELIRARDGLKGHIGTCPMDYDLDYRGPCRCGGEGAYVAKQAINRAIEALIAGDC